MGIVLFKKEEAKEGETAEVKAEAVAAPNTLTEAEKAEGWILMFDGKTTMEFHLWTDEWNELVKNSKFPGINPDFANVAKTGYIGLQDHGHAVWFRNLKIKEM